VCALRRAERSSMKRISPFLDRPQARGRFSRTEVVTVLVGGVLLGAALVLLMREWNPILSCDTHYNYFPTLEVLNKPGQGFVQLFVLPFFRADRDLVPPAQEGKPVFVCALRLWHICYRWLSPCQPGIAAPH